MVVGAFPVFKLGALVLKQVSKPLANVVKARAKSSPFFRNYICMPPAQFYHWAEVKMKMWTMNLGKPVNIPKLNESMAIDLGAELLGEGVIFVTAAGILIFEYVRNARKETAKEESREKEMEQIQSELKDLYFAKARQEAQLRELVRVLHKNLPSASISLSTNFNQEDIPEHYRDGVVVEEPSTIFGTMKGFVWQAIDILLPPVNDSEAIKVKPEVPKARTTIVNDPIILSSQKTILASKPGDTTKTSNNINPNSSRNEKKAESTPDCPVGKSS